ncbi:MAG TPA: sulfotransferase [Candidatus Krumholzibacteria bacterium]|nr:sulfotransferase [Candidatus Krumholzibacteria bacterium]HPD71429.1 sulfotransferase [Candidatus Krumholzibacteria bacterium]HRY41638.1 sulfotransferase [Candidatus Krumholzibacteria bacterium]
MPSTLSQPDLAAVRERLDSGRPAEALRLLLPLAASQPGDPETWQLVGRSALDLGNLDRAGDAYRQVLTLRPDHRDGLLGAGLVLQRRGLSDDACVVWRRAADLDAGDPVPPTLVGIDLMRRGRLADAEGWFREALARRPDHADAQAGLGSLLERTGRAAEGAAFLAPVAAGPQAPSAVVVIHARCLLSLGEAAAARASVERALDRGADRQQRVQLEHLLGDCLDELGETDAAFAAYARANGLRTAAFAGATHLGAARQYCRLVTAERLATLPRGRNRRRRSVLVVGVPRSGTSLIERMLAAHPRLAGAGELDTWRLLAVELASRWRLPEGDIWYRHLDRLTGELLDELGAAYLAELDRRGGDAPYVVDKMPQNTFQLPLAALALPGTVVVHAVRDPIDTGWSCFRQNFTDGLAWSTRLETIALYLRAERELMAHWKRVLEVPIVTVRYEELTRDPAAALRPVLTALGEAWHDEMLSFHGRPHYTATASYREVRRPLHGGAVGRAARYAVHLEPLRRLLAAFGPLPD